MRVGYGITGTGILSIGLGVSVGGGAPCEPVDQIDGNVAAGAIFAHPADGVIEWTQTTSPASGATRIIFRRESSENFWYVAVLNTNQLALVRIVNGTRTQVALSDQVVTSGAVITTVFAGTTISVCTDSVLSFSYKSATQFATATSGKRNDGTDAGMAAFVEDGVASDLKTWTLECYTARLFKLNSFSEASLASARADLIAKVWRTEGVLPTAGVDSIETGVSDPLSTSADGLASVDRFTTDVGDATDRINYVWHPTSPNGKLVIYHYGHTSENWNAGGKQVEMIHALIDAGYTVCGSQMPPGNVAGHNLYPAPNGSLNPLKYFLEDVIRCINELEGDYDEIYMAGLSGGSWTTVLCAAIDTRISRSVHVDGDYPLFISESSRDYEQFLPGVYPDFDYADLYVMASDNNRRQLQINVSNSGLFDEDQYGTAPYEDAVKARIPGSGTFDLSFDATTTSHEISAATRAAIIAFFDAE